MEEKRRNFVKLEERSDTEKKKFKSADQVSSHWSPDLTLTPDWLSRWSESSWTPSGQPPKCEISSHTLSKYFSISTYLSVCVYTPIYTGAGGVVSDPRGLPVLQMPVQEPLRELHPQPQQVPQVSRHLGQPSQVSCNSLEEAIYHMFFWSNIGGRQLNCRIFFIFCPIGSNQLQKLEVALGKHSFKKNNKDFTPPP